ncbi:MAG TPA: molybdopterin cofactor-binding domain-containing protein, partial [Burkholderiaceae bacterium]
MDTMPRVEPARREFLRTIAAAGGAFCLGVTVPLRARGAAAGSEGEADELNAWVVIRPDDTVVLRVARSEMGQGSETGLPMLIAEELQCDWSKVRAEFVPVAEHLRRNRAWGSMSTGGSRSIRESQEFLRKAGATAREMLIAAAAQQWKVEPSACRAAASVVIHEASGRRLSYGQLAAAAARLTPPAEVKLKDPKDWTLLGTPVARFDLRDKVEGRPVYGADVQLPGMLHASIAQCPVFGGRLKSVGNRDAVASMRGVKRVVELPDAVAVVADNWWRADRALAQLQPQWDDGGNGAVDSASIMEFLRAGHGAPDVPLARNDGDTPAALSKAARTVEAEYFTPFLNHATMEPQNATAWFKDDRLLVWVPTQNGEASAAAAAEAGGIALSRLELTKTQLGGGFGRRGAPQDYVRYAVAIAKQTPGVPVKLMYSRTEDMQHGYYRPISLVRQKAAIDADGHVTGWQTRLAIPSIAARLVPERVKNGMDLQACGSFADSPYEVPNQRVEFAMRNPHVPVGFWRSVYHSQNPFARECFLDEIAAALGKDPLALRRELLSGPKARRDRAILEVVAKAADWDRPPASGVSRGIAVVDAYGSYTAGVVELSARDGGQLELKRVIVAVDPGYVVNPDSARAQIEGSTVYALTAALYGENTVRDGRIVETNFNDYPMLLLRETPKIEAILAPSGGFWGGLGEPGVAPVAPALCNAIFAAT